MAWLNLVIDDKRRLINLCDVFEIVPGSIKRCDIQEPASGWYFDESDRYNPESDYYQELVYSLEFKSDSGKILSYLELDACFIDTVYNKLLIGLSSGETLITIAIMTEQISL